MAQHSLLPDSFSGLSTKSPNQTPPPVLSTGNREWSDVHPSGLPAGSQVHLKLPLREEVWDTSRSGGKTNPRLCRDPVHVNNLNQHVLSGGPIKYTKKEEKNFKPHWSPEPSAHHQTGPSQNQGLIQAKGHPHTPQVTLPGGHCRLPQSQHQGGT